MTTDESIMDEMFDRAINADKSDEWAIQMFCVMARNNAQLVQKAQEMIIRKIRSQNVTEAKRSIALLEHCMIHCSSEFQDAASKFRFLNELIRLVSKKYQGAETPAEVKERIMNLLLLWATKFPNKIKIREAYDILRKESGLDFNNSIMAASSGAKNALEKRESVLGAMDEEMFAKLIKSNNPENYVRANLLLQYHINQESKRNELLLQHKVVLQEIQNTVQVLNQMLNKYEHQNDNDESETLSELYRICKKHRAVFQHIDGLLDECGTELIEDTIEANTALLEVIVRYQQKVNNVNSKTTTEPAAATTTTKQTNNDFMHELLGDFVSNTEPKINATSTDSPTKLDTLDELSDIFANTSPTAATAASDDGKKEQLTSNKYPTELFQHTQLLQPVQLHSLKTTETTTTAAVAASTVGESLKILANGATAHNRTLTASKETATLSKLPVIDTLSDELFKKAMPQQIRTKSFKCEPKKITLSDLSHEYATPSKPSTTPNAIKSQVEDDANILINETQSANAITPTKISEPVITSSPQPSPAVTPVLTPKPENAVTSVTQKSIVHLSEIHIDLDNITPTDEQRIVLDDVDMQLHLNFTNERPNKYVSVFVITAQNKSQQTIRNFQFEASVKKPSKVRLLEPTNIIMPPNKPFRPSTPINQVMLLFNPTGHAVDITCIVGYKLGDDPDPIKESIVVKYIPYIE